MAYRLIYNWDGAPHGYGAPPQTMEQLMAAIYAPLAGTQCDALFFSCGGHLADYPSEVLPLVAEKGGREYDSVSSMTLGENIRSRIDAGEDYQRAMIDRGHELGIDVFASFRMNDNHFSGATTPAEASTQDDTTAMRLAHPEWTLGEQTAPWFACSWNLAVKEVREHIFAAVVELAERADWDGVELDWQRHGFHLPEHDAFRLRYVITDLQRAVREATQKIATKRGRPFLLAARVSTSLETCHATGYDVETWLQEGLVDMLIPAANAETAPDIDVRAWQELCRPFEVPVFPGFDASLPNASAWQGGCVGPEPMEDKCELTTRAIAARYHDAGCSGIYCFNWHSNGRDFRRSLLEVVGDPSSLARLDKVYAAGHRVVLDEGFFAGAYRVDRLWAELPVQLHSTLTNRGPSISLEVAPEQFPAATVQLRVRVTEWTPQDRVVFSWDEEMLGAPQSVVTAQQGAPHFDGGVAMGDVWLRWSLEGARQCGAGWHTLGATVVVRHPRLRVPIGLTDVELVVSYTTASRL